MSSLRPLATMQNDSANLPTFETNKSPEIQPSATSPMSNPQTIYNVPADVSVPAPSCTHDEKKLLATHLQSLGPVIRGLPRKIIYNLIGILILTALIPLLVVSFLLIRLLQFIRHGHGYYKATQLKFYIRFWMYNFLLSTALYLGIGSVIAEQRFKHGYWRIKVESLFYFKMCGIFVLSILVPCVIIPLIPPFPLNHTESGLNFREGVFEIIDCLILWWLGGSVVMNYFPILKDHQFLGLHTQKWIEVSLFVLMGYNVITICTHMIVLWLQDLVREDRDPGTDTEFPLCTILKNMMCKKYLLYCAIGIKHSINFVLNSVLLLLIWVLYFGSHLNETPRAKRVLEVGVWTCVSILICSFFWLIKTFALLLWEAVAVYNRFCSEILKGGKQLYFLGIIGRHSHDIFNLLYEDTSMNKFFQVGKLADQKEDKLNIIKKDRDENLRKYSLLSDVFSTHFSRIRNSPTFSVLVRFDKGKHDFPWYSSQFITSYLDHLARAGNHSMSKSDEVDEWEQEIEGLHDKDDECKKLKQKKKKKLSKRVKKRVKDDLLMQDDLNPTIHGIQQVAQYLLSARKHLLDDTKASGMLLKLEKDNENGIIGKNLMRQFIEGGNRRNNADEETQRSCEAPQERKVKHELDYFVDQIKDQSIKTSDTISINKIRACMDEAHTKCLILANKLSSANEVVNCLNNVISFVIISATFIMWLLLTGLATTKILVIIASLFLAATFIFGESCKTLFQGIIYAFVVHPFDVGDLCIIDGKMMEVRTIGIWKTTFTKVGTQEEVMFTNSQLSSKDIVNHRTKFDWNDSIELDIASLNKQKISELIEQIKGYLDKDEEKKFTAGYNSVVTFTTEDKIKLAINFRHNKDGKNSTNSENLKTKRELRSKLVIHVHDLLEQIK